MQRLSRRGKLPGFSKTGPASFSAAAFGMIYDRLLVGEIHIEASGSRVELRTELKRTLPIIVVAVYLFTLWPGVWLTDSMLTTYFSWYPREFWITCAWYIPLTLIAIPALLAQFRASQRAARAHGLETAQKIARALDAELVASDQGPSADSAGAPPRPPNRR